MSEQSKVLNRQRSASIGPRNCSNPTDDDSKRYDGDGVHRSVSDPKSERKVSEQGLLSSASGRNRVENWNTLRPTSLIVDPKMADNLSRMLEEDRLNRSESLTFQPGNDARRNESFRSTSSDTVLVRPLSVRPKKKSIKPSSSAPEVSNLTRQETIDENESFSCSIASSRNFIETPSVSSSNTSLNANYAISRDIRLFMDSKDDLDISNRDPSFRIDPVTGRSTPNFIVNLEDDTSLKETSVDDEEISSSIASFSEKPSMVDSEVQTDLSSFDDSSFDIGIQCNLLERLFISEQGNNKTIVNCERSASIDILENRGDVINSSSRRDSGIVALKHSVSESNLQSVLANTNCAHTRSLSDEIKAESPDSLRRTNVNGPRYFKRHSVDGPGMRALQSLSRSLESSINSRSSNESKNKELKKSPLSLRKVALLKTSPVPQKKPFNKEKRNSWHVDSVSEIERMEKELNSSNESSRRSSYSGSSVRSQDIGSPETVRNEILTTNTENKDKSKNKETKKNKGRRSKRNKNADNKVGDVVSGPNINRRKAQKIFLEESFLLEKA